MAALPRRAFLAAATATALGALVRESRAASTDLGFLVERVLMTEFPADAVRSDLGLHVAYRTPDIHVTFVEQAIPDKRTIRTDVKGDDPYWYEFTGARVKPLSTGRLAPFGIPLSIYVDGLAAYRHDRDTTWKMRPANAESFHPQHDSEYEELRELLRPVAHGQHAWAPTSAYLRGRVPLIIADGADEVTSHKRGDEWREWLWNGRDGSVRLIKDEQVDAEGKRDRYVLTIGLRAPNMSQQHYPLHTERFQFDRRRDGYELTSIADSHVGSYSMLTNELFLVKGENGLTLLDYARSRAPLL